MTLQYCMCVSYYKQISVKARLYISATETNCSKLAIRSSEHLPKYTLVSPGRCKWTLIGDATFISRTLQIFNWLNLYY